MLGIRGQRLRDEIAARGCAHATVTGTSMLPTLCPDEIVRLEPATDVRPGHVLAFEHGGGLLVHRVITVAPDHVVCRGDNRMLDDGVTPRRAIVGRAVEVFGPGRRGGVRLKDDAAALHAIDARLRRRRAAGQCRRVVAEVVLIARQAGGRAGGPVVLGRCAPYQAAPPDDVVAPDDLTAPYALSSRLDAADRVSLVAQHLSGEPGGTPVTIAALALTGAHRVARVGAAVRHALSFVGITAGQAGDAVLPGPDGRAMLPVHLFLSGELAAELQAAGAQVTAMDLEDIRGLPAWRATVVRRDDGRSPDARSDDAAQT